MKIGKFRFGGVHPDDHKEAAEVHSTKLPTPKSVLICSLQHAGAPANIVKVKNDIVKKGEIIATQNGFVSANIHSSVSGKVLSIETTPPPLGRGVNGCLIQTDENAEENIFNLNRNFMSLSGEEMLKKIADAGIVGMGGAMFPTSVKLSGALKSNCDVLLINGVECEPYITSDYRIMLEYAEELFYAVEIIRQVVPSIKRVVVGIEANKPKAIAEMKKFAKEHNVEIMTLRTRYPQGGEKMLIDAATGRVVPIGKFPPDIGVLVSNVATMFAIYEAVAKDKPLIERIVTVAGDAVKEMKNVLVPFGTKIADIIDFCGGVTSDEIEVIAGGPMMGFALPNLEQATIKGNNAILVLNKKGKKPDKEYACIKCGRCGSACPVKLSPTQVAHAGKVGDKDAMNSLEIMSCFECGACAYICPAKIPLVQWIRIGKDKLRR